MTNFIEITDVEGFKRLVNVNFITDIVQNSIFINSGCGDTYTKIDCKENYEEIKTLIKNTGNIYGY